MCLRYDRPWQAMSSTQPGQGCPVQVIPGQLQRAFATNLWPGIAGKGREAVDLLKDSQVKPGRLNGLKATEVLVMLIEAPDHHFYGIVRLGNKVTLDGVDQTRPVSFEKVKDPLQFGLTLDVLLPRV